MEQNIISPEVQQSESKPKTSDNVVELKEAISRITRETRQLEEILSAKLERGERDIEGICKRITMLRDQLQEKQSALVKEDTSDTNLDTRRRAATIIGQGVFDIRPRSASQKKPPRDRSTREVKARPGDNQ